MTEHHDIERPYYGILGVSRDASPDEIRSAYRRLVRTMHPDAGGNPDDFIKLNEAYNTLHDPVRRQHYDMSGEVGDWNALSFQEAIIKTLAEAFEGVVSMLVADGVPVNNLNFMATFIAIIEDGKDRVEKRFRFLQTEISALEKLRKRIKRSDGAKNLFVEIIDRQLKEKAGQYASARKDLEIARRVVDEAKHYDDIGELFTTMHAARWPGFGNKTFKNSNITT